MSWAAANRAAQGLKGGHTRFSWAPPRTPAMRRFAAPPTRRLTIPVPCVQAAGLPDQSSSSVDQLQLHLPHGDAPHHQGEDDQEGGVPEVVDAQKPER